MATVTALLTVHAIGAILAMEVAPLTPPAGDTGAETVDGVASTPIATLTGEVAAQPPCTTWAVDRAVYAMPTCFAGTSSVNC